MEKIYCSTPLELALLLLAALAYIAEVFVSAYAWWGDPGRIGLLTSLPTAFREYQVPISPPLWFYSSWLVLFAWQLFGLLFAVRFTYNRNTPRTIFIGFYPTFAVACALHVGWVFAWCRLFQELALALVAAKFLVLVICVGQIASYLYFIRGDLKYFYRCNFNFTRVLVLNGSVVFVTLNLLLLLGNLGAVLDKNAGLLGVTVSTILLSILASIVVTYFMLENTILDRFLRYVFIVYPTILFFLVSILTQLLPIRDLGALDDRNVVFVLVLTCVVGLLVLIRAVLWLVFVRKRPLSDYDRELPETVPL